jgi:DNA-binding winged helix-turn-helix (wHTH) protein
VKYFRPFRFDERELALWQGRARVRLTQKAAALLSCLLDEAPRWVSKDAILSQVWPDTHVHPDNIKVLVHELRVALADDAHRPTFIRGERGKGYLFVAPVSRTGCHSVKEADSSPIFVNRVTELATLTDLFGAALAGQPRLVVVRGERGIGKSALCRTFLRTASAVGPVRFAVGHCTERRTAAEPFEPFLDALQQLEREQPGLIEDQLTRHAPAWRPQFPEWRDGRAPVERQDTDDIGMINQLSTLLMHLTSRIPLVLVLENLQWADPSTCAALLMLGTRPQPGRFLLIGTGTSVMPAPGAGTVLVAAGIRTIALPPLSETQVTHYLDARFGGGCLSSLGPALRQLTGGNPSLIVECVDDLIDNGLVRRIGDGWEVVATLEQLEAALLPPLIQALQRRLEGVDDQDLAVLETAALLGTDFSVDGVAAAANDDRRSVSRRLRDLASQGYVTPLPAGHNRAAEATRYRFRFPRQAEILRRRALVLNQTPVLPRRRTAQHLRPA